MTDLVRWNPFEHLANIFREMDKMMQETMSMRDNDFKLQNNVGDIIVTMEIPGATRDNVNVMVNEDRVTVSGEARVTKNDKNSKALHWSTFTRCYALPEKVNTQASIVNFKGSNLEIKMPKLKNK